MLALPLGGSVSEECFLSAAMAPGPGQVALRLRLQKTCVTSPLSEAAYYGTRLLLFPRSCTLTAAPRLFPRSRTLTPITHTYPDRAHLPPLPGRPLGGRGWSSCQQTHLTTPDAGLGRSTTSVMSHRSPSQFTCFREGLRGDDPRCFTVAKVQ